MPAGRSSPDTGAPDTRAGDTRAIVRAFPAAGSGRRIRRAGGAVAAAAAALLSAALLAGCGGDALERARSETGEAAERIAALRDAPAQRFSTLTLIERRPWLGLRRAEPAPGPLLPAPLRAPDGATLPLAGIEAPAVLARRIEAATGIPVRFTGPAAGGDTRAGDTRAGDTRAEEPARAEAFAGSGIDGLSPDGGVWTGPLDALLDAWTRPAGYTWRYDAGGGAIEIVRRASAVFRIHALAGSQRYLASATTDDGADGGDEGGAVRTSQSIAAETGYDPWPEIEAQAAALVGAGTVVTVAPTSASVLVSGTPGDIGRVRAWLAWLNREVLRPVTLSVHVYSVRRERGADYGIGIAAAVRELFGTSAQLAVSPESVAVVRPTEAVGDTLAATVSALSRTGAVSRVLSADIPSLNGKPAQFFELYKESYLKEQRTTAGEGIAQTELVPGTVSSGFAASYVARITGPGEVLVRLFASLRDRPVFREYASGGRSIQLPAYASRAVQVTQRIRRGETLLVTGFSTRHAETSGSGTFHEDVPLPGGERRGTLARSEQVLLVTAAIGAPLGIAETGELPGTRELPGAGELPGTGERPGRSGEPL